jgi:hypothetical protein
MPTLLSDEEAMQLAPAQPLLSDEEAMALPAAPRRTWHFAETPVEAALRAGKTMGFVLDHPAVSMKEADEATLTQHFLTMTPEQQMEAGLRMPLSRQMEPPVGLQMGTTISNRILGTGFEVMHGAEDAVESIVYGVLHLTGQRGAAESWRMEFHRRKSERVAGIVDMPSLTEVAQQAGNLGFFILAGPAGIPLIGLSGFGRGYESAIEHGATPGVAWESGLLHAGVNVATLRLLRPLSVMTKSRIANILINTAGEGVQWGIAGAIMQGGDNMTAKALYDKDRPLSDKVLSGFAGGTVAGVIMGAIRAVFRMPSTGAMRMEIAEAGRAKFLEEAARLMPGESPPAPVPAAPAGGPAPRPEVAAAVEIPREEIAKRAYQISEAKGFPAGQAEADWAEAEKQLRTEKGTQLTTVSDEVTALMKDVQAKEAKARGEPAPTPGASVVFKEVNAAAAAKFAADPMTGQKLVTELEANPRETTLEDRAVLLHEKVRLRNEENALRAQRATAQKAGNTQVANGLTPQIENLVVQSGRVAQAASQTITSPAKQMRFQQEFMAMDYTAAAQLERMRDGLGRPTTPKEEGWAQKKADEYAAISQKLLEATARAEQAEAALAAKKPPKGGAYGSRNVLVVTEDYNAALGRVKAWTTRLSAGIDPTIAPDLAKVALYHLEATGRDFGAWSKRMIESIDPKIQPFLADLFKQANEEFDRNLTKTEAKGVARRQKTIAELEGKLAAGDYAKAEPRVPRALSKEELRLQSRLNFLRWQMDRARMMPAEKLWEGARDVGRFIRNVAGGDISNALRQLRALGGRDVWSWITYPYTREATFNWAKTVYEQLGGYFGSEAYYQQTMTELKVPENTWYINWLRKPKYRIWTEVEPGTKMADRPESALSQAAQKIPLIRRGNRAQNLGVDVPALLLAKELIPRAKAMGKFETEADQDDVARQIGDLVGRGTLPRIKAVQDIARVANDFAFSFRFALTKFNNVTTLFHTLSTNPRLRAEGFKTLAGNVVMVTAAAYVAKELGADVEVDPRSADFLKIKIGNTRYDLLGGEGQVIRFMAQMAVGQRKQATGNIVEVNRGEIFWRFLQNKQAPIISLIAKIFTGKTALGRKIEGVEGWTNEMVDSFLFLWLSDGVDAFKDEYKKSGLGPALLKGAEAAAISWTGQGVMTYEPQKPTKQHN